MGRARCLRSEEAAANLNKYDVRPYWNTSVEKKRFKILYRGFPNYPPPLVFSVDTPMGIHQYRENIFQRRSYRINDNGRYKIVILSAYLLQQRRAKIKKKLFLFE